MLQAIASVSCTGRSNLLAAWIYLFNQAYLAGFVDTDQGKSLDLVVSILGITRKTKGNAIGQVTFLRDLTVDGNITINEGTLLSTLKGEATFVTTEIRSSHR